MWDKLCNDIKLIVYQCLHCEQLSRCLGQLFTLLIWDDNSCGYISVKHDAVNIKVQWRLMYDNNNVKQEYRYIFKIWERRFAINHTTGGLANMTYSYF